jgi:hypothetical protein
MSNYWQNKQEVRTMWEDFRRLTQRFEDAMKTGKFRLVFDERLGGFCIDIELEEDPQ